MKTTSPLLILTVWLLTACSFSAGTKKDLTTGLSYSYNGFTVSEVYFVDAENIPKGTNEVDLNTEVALVVQGISNYTLVDEKAYPGMSLYVTDNNGNQVIAEADMFASNIGYSAEDASVLRGTITVGEPMVSGETYHVEMKIWDKNKTDNTISVGVDLRVK
ncbi:MAG: hypothetical protein HRU69_12530 [Flammeovirgaceae bacterium]|nr:MAG: hypothetical protein HRU69_12530 [Flammeovirgaceae bacterium]